MNKAEFEEMYSTYKSGNASAQILQQLEPYKVDNAIIMAAGESKRCLPLSKVLPKGLFVLKGEVLIEREIRQLQEAGIKEIIVIVGYMADAFFYLEKKYGVKLVINEEYNHKNNVSSLYAARNYLGNSYICCADNYYSENVFEKYVYEAFYLCNYTQEYADEYCIWEDESGYITKIARGGNRQYFTIGANYWSRHFSKKFIELLTCDYNKPDVGNMLIDDFHIKHLSDLPITAKKMKDGIIYEFDTLKECEEFDANFYSFFRTTMENNLYQKYEGITRYAGVLTENKTGRLHFNENLWGPSPKCLEVFKNVSSEDLYLYDSKKRDDLIEVISKKFQIPYENLYLHNSASELIKSIMNIMVSEDDIVLLPKPFWSYYPGVVDYKFGKKIFYNFLEGKEKCYHDVNDILSKASSYCPKLIIITTPAMPSGNLIYPNDLELVIKRNPGSLILVDQAYYGFEDNEIDINYFINHYDNVVFTRTFSKFYGLAGMRLGYGIASKKALKTLWLDLPLLRLPSITRRVAAVAIEDEEYYEKIKKEIATVKQWFYKELCKIDGIYPFLSDTNFIYMRVENCDAFAIKKAMEENGYLFRLFEGGNNPYFRINVAPMGIMKDFMDKFRGVVKQYQK